MPGFLKEGTIILGAVGLSLLGVAIGAVVLSKEINYEKPLPTLAPASVLTSGTARADTDSDGLADWEEALWKTDPQNHDSDGDGTEDGAEVRAGRHPLQRGPADTLPTTGSSLPSVDPTSSATDQFAQKLFRDYVTLRSGLPLSAADEQLLIRNALSDLPAITAVRYTRADLVLTANTNDEEVRVYGNALGAIIEQYGKPKVANELLILRDALTKENPAKLAELDIIIESYRNVIDALLKVPTPGSAADAHLALVNSASEAHAAIVGMRSVFEDPLTGLASMRAHQLAALNLTKALNGLRQYFAKEGISFSNIESGFMFTAGIGL